MNRLPLRLAKREIAIRESNATQEVQFIRIGIKRIEERQNRLNGILDSGNRERTRKHRQGLFKLLIETPPERIVPCEGESDVVLLGLMRVHLAVVQLVAVPISQLRVRCQHNSIRASEPNCYSQDPLSLVPYYCWESAYNSVISDVRNLGEARWTKCRKNAPTNW